MVTLGLDPSLSSTGWAIVDVLACKLIASGCIRTRASQSRAHRLHIISCEGEEIMRRAWIECGARLAAFEIGMAYGRTMAQGALAVAESRGVLLAGLEEVGFSQTRGISPATAKKAVSGNGRASKSDVQRAVRRILRLPKALGEDESDAAAIALAAGGYGRRAPK